MPYLFPLDENGQPTKEHGLLDLAPQTTVALVHRLMYNVEGIDEVCVAIETLEGGAFSGTTVEVLRGTGNSSFASMASAMSFTGEGVKFAGDVADVPRLLVNNTTPGSGTGKARIVVWGSPLR